MTVTMARALEERPKKPAAGQAKSRQAALKTIESAFDADVQTVASWIESGPPGDWRARAACRGSDTNEWFPGRGAPTAIPKETCRACKVREMCLLEALLLGDRHGVWGGKSERERRTIRKALKAIDMDLPSKESANDRDDWSREIPEAALRATAAVLVDRIERRERARTSRLPAPPAVGRLTPVEPVDVPKPLFTAAQRQMVQAAAEALRTSPCAQLVASRSDVDLVAAGTGALLDSVDRVLVVVPSLASAARRVERWRNAGGPRNTVVVGGPHSVPQAESDISFESSPARLADVAGPDEVLMLVPLAELETVLEAGDAGLVPFDLLVADDLDAMLQAGAAIGSTLLEDIAARRRLFVHRTPIEYPAERFGTYLAGKGVADKAS